MESVYNLPYFLPERSSPFLLTGLPEVDWEILLKADGQDLLNFCDADDYLAEICSEPTFWKRKITLEYNANVASQNLLGTMPYKDYYRILSDDGFSIIDTCNYTSHLNFCTDDDFWSKKVAKTFGSQVADLNRMKSRNRGKTTPHYRQYEKLWVWYVRHTNPGPIGHPVYPPITLETVLTLAGKYLLNSSFQDIDVLLWLMYFPIYKNMLLENIDILSIADTQHNFISLMLFLYRYGIVNVEEHRPLLEHLVNTIISNGRQMFVMRLVKTNLLEELNMMYTAALMAAERNNIWTLEMLYEKDNSIVTPELIEKLDPEEVLGYVDEMSHAIFVSEVLGIPLDTGVFDRVMANDGFDAAKDLYEMGIIPDAETFSTAINAGVDEEMLDFLLEIGTPTDFINPDHVDVEYLQPKTISWLRRNKFGDRFGDALSQRIRNLA